MTSNSASYGLVIGDFELTLRSVGSAAGANAGDIAQLDSEMAALSSRVATLEAKPAGIADAPSDAFAYLRSGAAWLSGGLLHGVLTFLGAGDGSSASAGTVGEVLSASFATPVSMTSGVTGNVGSLALTPGDWQVSGLILFSPEPTTTVSQLAAAISTAAATLPTPAQLMAGIGALQQFFAAFAAEQPATLSTGGCRINVAAPITVYLTAVAAFAVSTMTVTGYIYARRAR